MQAVILAAGMGTRMGKLTKETPKPLLKLNSIPIIEHIIRALPESIEDIIIVTSPNTVSKFKAQFGDQFQTSKGLRPIAYAIQSNEMAGTYGALHSAKPYLKKEFIVLNGDDIIDTESLEELIRHDLAMGFSKQIPPAPNYFIFKLNSEGFVQEMVRPSDQEAKSKQLIATGTYKLNSSIWDLQPVHLSGNEYGLPQTLQPILNKFRGVTLKKWLKINTPEDLEIAKANLKH